ncbi:MAG TPA: hypothetical protein VKT75_19145 [Acidobacteriaceae bacterium]|nr:hypothetical protein [Acidobacteriaceae bacterium]
MTHSTHSTEPHIQRAHEHRLLRRFLIVICSVALAAFAGLLVAGDILLHRAGPMLKAKVIETLSARYDSRVELDNFQVSMVKGFEVSGTGLRLYPNHLNMTSGAPGEPARGESDPMLEARNFSFHMVHWQQLFRSPIFVNRVQVHGLTVRIPPKNQRSGVTGFSGGGPGQDASTSGIKVQVGQVLIDQADLIIENGNPAKQPLHFVIHRLRLTSVAAGRPLKFHAILVNPKPVGDIDSSGDFGPFNQDSPGDTPLDGTYSFTNANLNPFKGIGGTLSSTGSYSGQLDRIDVNGETRTPNFSLDTANRPVPLNTTFHATVDGTSGDTYLSPVDAWLSHTHIVATGKVVRNPSGEPGHDIHLTVTIGPGRTQDVLDLASSRQPVLMNGDLQLHADLLLPPGPGSVTSRVRLDGTFAIAGARFTSAKLQHQIDQLSLRGQGKAGQAQQENAALKAGNLQAATAAGVRSDMRGNFLFANRRLSLTGLNYQVPGAKIALSGTYNLNGESLDFHGTARMDAHISQMVTGWKALLLIPVDPFFAKHGAGTEVPVAITGTRANPQIGMDHH